MLDLSIKLKKNLLQRFPRVMMRTDLQNLGIYIMKSWIIKFLIAYEEEQDKIEISSVKDELISFIARNQFKSSLRKHMPLPKKDSMNDKLALIMNP